MRSIRPWLKRRTETNLKSNYFQKDLVAALLTVRGVCHIVSNHAIEWRVGSDESKRCNVSVIVLVVVQVDSAHVL